MAIGDLKIKIFLILLIIFLNVFFVNVADAIHNDCFANFTKRLKRDANLHPIHVGSINAEIPEIDINELYDEALQLDVVPNESFGNGYVNSLPTPPPNVPALCINCVATPPPNVPALCANCLQNVHPYPLPDCYTNDSGFMCCNEFLEYLMKVAYLEIRQTNCGAWNNNNIQALTNAIQKRVQHCISNITFEVITGHSDFVAQIQFSGNLVCKIHQEGKVILAFATPQPVPKPIRTSTHRIINYEKELQEAQGHLGHSYVYLGLDYRTVNELRITHAVDATNFPHCLRLADIEYYSVDVDDCETSELRKFFEPVTKFIISAKQSGGKVLVYCAAGISRSASICMIYLMLQEGISLREAYCDIVNVRPIIAPNLGFWSQMIEYEKEKYGRSTVTLLKGMRKPIPDVYINKSKPVDEMKWKFFCEKYPDAERDLLGPY